MSESVCCVDLGTSRIKVSCVDAAGHYAATWSAPTPSRPDADGLWPVDPDACFELVCRGMRSVASAQAGAVRAVVVTCQRATVVALDRAERPLCVLSWQDIRGQGTLDRLLQQLPVGDFVRITGLPPSPIYSLASIVRLAEVHPELFAQADRFVTLHDLLLRRLGAETYITDPSNASATALFNPRQRRWSQTMLDLAGLTRPRLPEVRPAGSRVGQLRPELAQSTGLTTDTALVVGGGDQQCASLALGGGQPQVATLGLGTAAVVTCAVDCVPDWVHERDPTSAGYFFFANVIPELWVVEGFLSDFASALAWSRQVLAPTSTPDRPADITAGSPPLFLPLLSGIGVPDFDPRCRGAWIGLDRSHGPHDLARSVQRGLALELRRVFDGLARITPLKRVVMPDDPPGSDTGRRLVHMLPLPVSVFSGQEATSLGAACVAWSGIDRFTSMQEAAAALTSGAMEQPQQRREQQKQQDKQLYRRYCAAVEAVRRLAGHDDGV